MRTALLVLVMLVVASTAKPEDREIEWQFGGGLRLNYLGLSGGMSGYSVDRDHEYKLDYNEIGMDNYAPSLALTFGGRYKKWNLFFSASRGSYTGSFVTEVDIERDDTFIPAGSEVDGQIDMGIYALTTTFAVVRRKHDLGVGLGFLVLNMGTEYSTAEESFGGNHWFPMPFLALSGRLNFNRLSLSAVGGGAYFDGVKDDWDYTVEYYNVEARGAYDFYQRESWAAAVSLGYRYLYMDSTGKKDGNWFREEDVYQGPFLSVRAKYTVFGG